jgi:hypothetical protein
MCDYSDASDLWHVRLPEGTATLLFKTPHKERGGELSHDGRWIAYSSDETGRDEIYVQPFPATGARWRISTQGGVTPRWRGDDRELFFLDPTQKTIIVVDVRLAPAFSTGEPRSVVPAPRIREGGTHFDVTADGHRVLIVQEVQGLPTRAITLVQNWTAGVKRQSISAVDRRRDE